MARLNPVRWLCPGLVLALVSAGHAVQVTADPPAWDLGVRDRDTTLAKTIVLRPPPDRNLRVQHVMGSAPWIQPRITRARGTDAAAATVEVQVDTHGCTGRVAGAVFVTFSGEATSALRIPVSATIRASAEPARVEVFFAREDAAGRAFEEWWRTTGVTNDRIEILPVNTAGNYKRLRERQKMAMPENGAADVAAYVDGQIALYGLAEVKNGLKGLLNLDGCARGRSRGGERVRGRETAEVLRELGMDGPTATAAGGATLEVWLFYFADCHQCREARRAVDSLKASFGQRVSVHAVDATARPDAIALAYATLAQYEDAPSSVPSSLAFVGGTLLAGAQEILSDCRRTAEAQLAIGGAALRVRRPESVPSLDAYARTLGIWPLIVAAAADGINPCAFAAMILLVSILTTREGRTDVLLKRRILVGGGAFCLGVFAVYYVSGLVVLEGMGRLRGQPWVDAGVFWAVWLLAMLGCVLSIRDAWIYHRTGDAQRLVLKVPSAIRTRFGSVIRGRYARLGLVFGGFAAGGIIAVLEGICTGQMYLPAIQYMVREPDLRARGLVLLFVYNLIFVLPLIAILAVALLGVHFRQMSAFLERHLVKAKLLLAFVFLLLATAMMVQRFIGWI